MQFLLGVTGQLRRRRFANAPTATISPPGSASRSRDSDWRSPALLGVGDLVVSRPSKRGEEPVSPNPAGPADLAHVTGVRLRKGGGAARGGSRRRLSARRLTLFRGLCRR